MGRHVLLIVCLTLLAACKPTDGQKMVLDPYGFAHQADSSGAAPIFNVSIGNPASRLVKENPYLRGVVQQTFNRGDQLRLSLQTDIDVRYNDGDMRLNVLTNSVSADGDETTLDRVSFIGGQLRESPMSGYAQAFALAKKFMQRLESDNPGIRNLRHFYQTASQDQLTAIGGELWANVAEKRSNEDSFEYLGPIEEAEQLFKEAVVKPLLDQDGRPVRMYALLGVYASKWTIVAIGVSSTYMYGGQNLTAQRRMAQSYLVTFHIRRRNDVDVASMGR